MGSDIKDLDTLIEEALALSKMNYQESPLGTRDIHIFQFYEIHAGHIPSAIEQ